MDGKDRLILLLAERVYICSRLLTAAAERLSWDSAVVQDLMRKLRETTEGEHASV